ncbi:MAG: hypothetical protein CM1200mP28_12690 [Deltaproteobacteria bacterium]|nr:MAG: hypothetical protein CM1200mP28_12690 [Deltaproteobacteria bacterium]
MLLKEQELKLAHKMFIVNFWGIYWRNIAILLKECGVQWCIVGHSERRYFLTNQMNSYVVKLKHYSAMESDQSCVLGIS